MWKAVLFTGLIFFTGCVVPADVFFRNFSNETVRLQARLTDRRYFNKLPNRVDFYDTSEIKRKPYGRWKYNTLVTWVDTTTFYIDVPAATVVNIKDLSNGLILGSRQPDVLLLMTKGTKTDTLITGDYLSVDKKFKFTGYGMFKPARYYYDVRD